MELRDLATRPPAILIVEDQIIIASAIRDSLLDMGADVVGPCLTLETAVDTASAAIFDAAVLDVWLHGQPCYPVADILTERGIPFIFTSGVNSEREPPKFHRVPRLMKPFSNQELHGALTRLWALPSLI